MIIYTDDDDDDDDDDDTCFFFTVQNKPHVFLKIDGCPPSNMTQDWCPEEWF